MSNAELQDQMPYFPPEPEDEPTIGHYFKVGFGNPSQPIWLDYELNRSEAGAAMRDLIDEGATPVILQRIIVDKNKQFSTPRVTPTDIEST